MERTYSVRTFCGSFVIVTYDEFDSFLKLLDLAHPDYVCVLTRKDLCNHTYYINHFYVNDVEVANVISDSNT